MADRLEKMTTLADQVEELVEQLKLLNLNLTVSSTRLYQSDDAFRAVAGDFERLLAVSARSKEEVAYLLKKLKGENDDDRDQISDSVNIDPYAEQIKNVAERIISTVMALKGHRSIEKEL